jgi:uncharacterized protein with HEPN domain
VIINEGMWANDLEDLLQPLLSIDEYESKIDDTAVAIGFFINDADAADDLARFLQKSAVPLIDCDVSPAPDQRGYYIVFVELPSNDRFTENLRHICDEVGQLAGITHWKIKMRGMKKVIDFDEEQVKRTILRNVMSDKLTRLRNQLKELKKSQKEG